ncbi:D-alanine--D-alanine ligase [Trichlorobacter ammonificans]|uniref:D-alanine--D-alanine ligase n=1 Tax=Trichlorobacter ammonificans TaxID=2916410 RepID=A0ABM9DAQ4_9BACT|nr:D-alanine--D-alanine ligase [Trichlorobacter ammonificans]CAH2032253.1 D-alanine--D-alanine ligase B [Trichlorobacter ammonificans]
MKDKRIGVLMGGLSAERDVSIKSGMAVHQALLKRGYDSTAIDVRHSVADVLREERIEVAFVALHGRYGEDGCIQGLLELMQIPYTGSGVLASALAMHKLYAKQAFSAAGLLTTPFVAVQRGATITPEQLPFGLPAVVKPVQEGSSVGVAIVKQAAELAPSLDEAFRYDRIALVEQYVKGQEVQVGILNDRAIGAIEIIPKKEFYDYEAKYADGMAEHVFPARLAAELYETVQQLGVQAHRALGCSGYSRVDFLVTEQGDCYVLEVNTLPGMTALSLLPEIALKGAGLSFEDLVEEILSTAGLKTGSGA